VRKGVKVRFKVYKKVAKEIFPNTLIIPDKPHLVAEVNSALDKVRKRLRRRGKESWGKR
jgi:transposase